MTIKNAQVTANSWTVTFWMNYKGRTYKILADVNDKIQLLEIDNQLPGDESDNNLIKMAMDSAEKVMQNMDYETLTFPYNIQITS